MTDEVPEGFEATVLDVVAFPTYELDAGVRRGPEGSDVEGFTFSKFGLVVRAEKAAVVEVADAGGAGAALDWATTGVPRVGDSLQVGPCRGSDSQSATADADWVVFAGGIWVSQPACVTLRVSSDASVFLAAEVNLWQVLRQQRSVLDSAFPVEFGEVERVCGEFHERFARERVVAPMQSSDVGHQLVGVGASGQPGEESAENLDAIIIARYLHLAHATPDPNPFEFVVLRGREIGEELWDVVGGDGPQLVHVDAVVVVCEQVARVDDVPPRHVGMLRLVLGGQCVRCFADDLQQPLSGSLSSPVCIEGVAAVGDEVPELLASLDDVGDAQVVTPAQIGTASWRMWSSRSFKPPTDTTST